MLETYWLRASHFATGDEITIADLIMVTELDMLHMLAGTSEVSVPSTKSPTVCFTSE